MNRVVIASVVSVLILIAALSGVIYFNKYRGTGSSTLKAVPADAAFIISAKLNRHNVQTILESRFIKNFTELDGVKKLETCLTSFEKLITTDADFRTLAEDNFITISLHPTKVDDYDMVFYVNTTGGLSTTVITQKIQAIFDTVTSEKTRNYVGVDVHDLTLKNNIPFSYAISGDILIASYTPFLVEDALRQLKAGNAVSNDPSFKKLQLKDAPVEDFTLYVNYTNLPKWLAVFCNQDNIDFDGLQSFANWSKLNITFKNNSCFLNGTTTFNDTSSFVSLFANQSARSLKVFTVIPENTAVVKAFGVSDKKSYFDKLRLYNNKMGAGFADDQQKIQKGLTDLLLDEYGLLITEPGSVNYTNSCFAYFKVSNNKTTVNQLIKLVSDKTFQAKVRTDNYRNHIIVSTGLEHIIENWLGKSFSDISKFCFTEIDNFIFIGNTTSSVKLLIDAYEDKNLLGKSSDFSAMQSNFSTVASYFYYAQIAHCQYLLKSKANTANTAWLEENNEFISRFDSYAFQIKNNGTLYETAAYLHTVENVKNKISVLWAEQLDYNAEIAPQLILTKDSGTYIAIQDTSHQLYLINNSGTVVWHKLLNDSIISSILSLDLYKNGNRQLVFNTATELWVLDLKGEAVANYPIKLPAPASSGLTAIDYDNTLDYRIYVPCSNGQLYGYLASGKPIPRFSFKCPSGVINEPITSFKMNGIDYVIANNSLGNMYVFDRNGKTVLSVSEPIYKNPNARFEIIKDSSSFTFTTTDTAGNKIAIDSLGKVIKTPVDYLTAVTFNTVNDGKTIRATVIDNRIIVSDSNNVQLFAFSAPESLSGDLIISNDNKGNPVYLFTTKNSEQVYMLNYKGKVVQGFPLKCIGKPLISDLNGDKMKRLILMNEGSTITVYSY